MIKSSGLGPGGYYVAILIQILVVFPFLYLCFYKKPIHTVVILFVGCIIFEACVKYFAISGGLYRLIAVRYFPFIVAGMLLARNGKSIKFFDALKAMVLGVAFIIVMNYTQYKPLIFSQWITTAFPTVLYAFFLVFITLNYFKLHNRKLKFGVTLIGQASYHIFLAQMLYFYLGSDAILNMLKPLDVKFLQYTLHLCISVAIYLCSGLIFFFLEERLLYKRNAIKDATALMNDTKARPNVIKTCIACGMTMEKADDFAMGDSNKDYCHYCARTDGSMKSLDECIEASIPWAMEEFKITEEEARIRRREHYGSQPAFKDREETVCDDIKPVAGLDG